MCSLPLSGFDGYESTVIEYKVTDGGSLSLDVLYPSAKQHTPVPVLLHYHGGFLVIGDRYSFMPYWLVNACVDRGWIFITPDYRLLPETTAHDSVQDAVDAYHWVLESLSSQLQIEPGPVILAGSSAGGYLALVTACISTQKPTALLSIYGMLDPADQRYQTKGTNIFGRPVEDTATVLERLQLMSQSKPKVLSGYSWPRDPSDPRYAIVSALHIEALVPDFLSGMRGLSEAMAQRGVDAVPVAQQKLFPLSFGMSAKLPPTIIFHGKDDSAVPWRLSQTASEILGHDGVDVHTEFPTEASHGFDARAGRVNIEKDITDSVKTPAFDSLRNVLNMMDTVIAARGN